MAEFDHGVKCMPLDLHDTATWRLEDAARPMAVLRSFEQETRSRTSLLDRCVAR